MGGLRGCVLGIMVVLWVTNELIVASVYWVLFGSAIYSLHTSLAHFAGRFSG